MFQIENIAKEISEYGEMIVEMEMQHPNQDYSENTNFSSQCHILGVNIKIPLLYKFLDKENVFKQPYLLKFKIGHVSTLPWSQMISIA